MPEQDAAYQTKDVEGRLERLQERVQALETTRTVVIAIAAIFGIAGSWGLVVLQKVSGMQTQVENLRAQVEQLQKGTQQIFDAERRAARLAEQDFENSKNVQLVDFRSRAQQFLSEARQNVLSGFVSKDNSQPGWPLDGRHPSVDLDLPVTFQHPLTNPEVAVAIQGLDANTPAGVRIAAYAVNITSAGFTVRVHTWATSSVNGFTISWIAHGK